MQKNENRSVTTNLLACELIDKVKQLQPNERFLIGIVGYPGAGKSTVANALASEVNTIAGGDCCGVVPMDGFHYANEKLTEMGLLPLKGIPATFDAEAFIILLAQLRENRGSTFAPRFYRKIEASVENDIEIRQTQQLVIVEGNYLLLDEKPWNKIRHVLDEVWFIDTDFDIIYPRLIERHMQGGKTEDAARAKVESTDMPNARLIEESRRNAHRLINVDLGTAP